ncbi:MAG: fused DSP-PTPase phosphatase/NAD kinase-like protein [Roseicyclus sp.]
MPLLRRLTDLERRWRDHYNVAPVDAETWARARIYNLWFDHAVLRTFWTNQAEVAPGVLRSNHPTHGRLKRLKAQGLVSVLSLRGSDPSAHNETLRLWCADLGLKLHTVAMQDRRAPARDTLLELIATFRVIEKPFLIHCKAGADRAGMASAIWLMVMEGVPLAEARAMLSWRHWHLARSRAGALGAVFDAYAEDGAEAAMPFETWVATRYDADAVDAAFRGRRGKG